MKHRIKALGAGALAVMAVVAFSGSATATGGGHFVSGVAHTQVELVSNKTGHSFTWWNSNGTVTCGKSVHTGTIPTSTAESIVFNPGWEGCATADGIAMSFTTNGCTFRLKVAAGTTASTEQTMHLECPTGKVIEVHQSSCLVTMVPQAVEKAATYATMETNGKHAVTVSLNATLETQFHGGICVFLGTKQSTTLTGSAVLSGFSPINGEPVSLTAT